MNRGEGYTSHAGTCWWNKVLSAPPAYLEPIRRFSSDPGQDGPGDKRTQRITRNVIDKMISIQIVR